MCFLSGRCPTEANESERVSPRPRLRNVSESSLWAGPGLSRPALLLAPGPQPRALTLLPFTEPFPSLFRSSCEGGFRGQQTEFLLPVFSVTRVLGIQHPPCAYTGSSCSRSHPLLPTMNYSLRFLANLTRSLSHWEIDKSSL